MVDLMSQTDHINRSLTNKILTKKAKFVKKQKYQKLITKKETNPCLYIYIMSGIIDNIVGIRLLVHHFWLLMHQ